MPSKATSIPGTRTADDDVDAKEAPVLSPSSSCGTDTESHYERDGGYHAFSSAGVLLVLVLC